MPSLQLLQLNCNVTFNLFGEEVRGVFSSTPLCPTVLQYLGKSGCSHLNPALIRSVDLQVMSICAVQTQQATARKTCVVT